MGPQTRKVASFHGVVAAIASGQHGVVTRGQLLDAGITPSVIRRRVQAGLLIRVHPGVYRVGHAAPSVEATYMAAVKACGDDALLSGRAAGHLHRLFRGRPPRPEVTTRDDRQVRGVVIHRASGRIRDAATRRGIPITTVPRTIVDLAAVLSARNLARVVHEAAVNHRIEPDEIEAVLGRRHNWPGCRELRAVLHGDMPVTLSRLESRFLHRLRQAGLPQPRSNDRVGGRYVDCRWPEYHLTVELDSYRYHRTRHAWEQDRAREREARARGDEFRRYTFEDVYRHPAPMISDLCNLIGQDLPG